MYVLFSYIERNEQKLFRSLLLAEPILGAIIITMMDLYEKNSNAYYMYLKFCSELI